MDVKSISTIGVFSLGIGIRRKGSFDQLLYQYFTGRK